MSYEKIDEKYATETESLGHLSITCSALSLALSAQAKRDSDTCFLVRAIYKTLPRQKT